VLSRILIEKRTAVSSKVGVGPLIATKLLHITPPKTIAPWEIVIIKAFMRPLAQFGIVR
jgi:hypothetical protein